MSAAPNYQWMNAKNSDSNHRVTNHVSNVDDDDDDDDDEDNHGLGSNGGAGFELAPKIRSLTKGLVAFSAKDFLERVKKNLPLMEAREQLVVSADKSKAWRRLRAGGGDPQRLQDAKDELVALNVCPYLRWSKAQSVETLTVTLWECKKASDFDLYRKPADAKVNVGEELTVACGKDCNVAKVTMMGDLGEPYHPVLNVLRELDQFSQTKFVDQYDNEIERVSTDDDVGIIGAPSGGEEYKVGTVEKAMIDANDDCTNITAGAEMVEDWKIYAEAEFVKRGKIRKFDNTLEFKTKAMDDFEDMFALSEQTPKVFSEAEYKKAICLYMKQLKAEEFTEISKQGMVRRDQ